MFLDENLPDINGGQDTIINLLAFQFAKSVQYIEEAFYHFWFNITSETNRYTANKVERHNILFSYFADFGQKYKKPEGFYDALHVVHVHWIRTIRRNIVDKREVDYGEFHI